MTCRDRTNEFLSAVKSLQSRQSNGYVSTRKDLSYRSEFMLSAKKNWCRFSEYICKIRKTNYISKT